MCPQTSTLPLCPKHPSTQQVLTGLELTEIRLLLPPNVGIQGIYHHTFGYKFLFFFFLIFIYLFYVREYTVAVQMVMSLYVVVGNGIF